MINKKAYAKINLFLNVLDRRKDGYHNLEMINAKIDLFDDIKLEKCEKSTGIIIKSNDLFLSNHDNVILQCARFMQDKYKIRYGIKIIIDKKIPYGAGLGGNSTDAASVIKGINDLSKLNLSLEEMKDIGGMFGADIPYCLHDEVALVTKTGENIEILDHHLKGKSVLVVHPKKHILTSSIFEIADEKGYESKDIKPLLDAIKNQNIKLIQDNLYNSLEDIVINMDQEMADFKTNLIENIGNKGLVMTGSGSTFIQLLDQVSEGVKRFVRENNDKFLIKIHKII